jgi:large subunit ribosomal protein L7/L12
MATSNIDQIVEQVSKMSLLEVAELVKALEDKFGVSAAAPVAAVAAPAEAAAPAEEKTEFKVTLKDTGSEKIKVIKALRSVTSLNLKDAKDMVESAPAVVAESAAKDDANKMKEALEAAGAKVELS